MSFSQGYLLADQGHVDSSPNNNDVIASSCLTSSSADASVYSPSSTKANLNLSRLPPKKRSGQPKLSQDYFEDTDNESDSDDELMTDHPGRDQQDHSFVRRRRLDSSSSSSTFMYHSASSRPRRNNELELATKEEEEYLPRRVKSCDSSSSKKTKKTCKKKHSRKTRYAKKKQPKKSKTGRWTIEECKAFLIGLQKHGKGKWSRIAKDIPTRDTVQVKTHAQGMLRKLQNGEDIFALLREDGEKQLFQEPIVIDLRSKNKDHLSFQAYDDVTDVEGDDDEEDSYDGGGVNTDLPSSTSYHHHYTMSGSTTKNSQVWTSPTPQKQQQQEPAHGNKHCPYERSDVASTTSAMEYFNQNSHTLFKVSPFTFSHCTTSTYHVPSASTGFLPQTPISEIYSHSSSSFTSHTADIKDQHGSNSYSNRKKSPRKYAGNSLFNNDILLSSAAKILVEMSSPPAVARAGEFKIGSALDQETGRIFTPLRGSFPLATNNIHPTQTPSDRIVSL